MGKTQEFTLEDAKKLDEKIAKNNPDKKPVPLGKIISIIVKKKKQQK